MCIAKMFACMLLLFVNNRHILFCLVLCVAVFVLCAVIVGQSGPCASHL